MIICDNSEVPQKSIFRSLQLCTPVTGLLCRDNRFKIHTLSDVVSSGKKFVYHAQINLWHIKLTDCNNESFCSDFYDCLRNIITSINEGRCLLFFNICVWPFSVKKEREKLLVLQIILKKIGITDFKNIIIITNTHQPNKNIFLKNIFWEYFESTLRNAPTREVDYTLKLKNLSNTAYGVRFLFLNHRDRPHRIYLFCKLHASIKNFSKLFAASMSPDMPMFSRWGMGYTDYLKKITPFKTGTGPEWLWNSHSEQAFLNKFADLTDADFIKLLTNTRDIVEYNHTLFKSRFSEQEIYNEILKFYNESE